MSLPTAGDLVCCLSPDVPGVHIRRIVTRQLELEQHELLWPQAMCGAGVIRDTLDEVDDADCPRCAAARLRIPR